MGRKSVKKTNCYNAIFKAMPLACLVLKPDGESFTIVDANEDYLQLVQAEPQDLFGKPTQEAFPHNPCQEENERTKLQESLQQVIRTGEKDSIDLMRFDVPVRRTNEFSEKYWSLENIPVLGENGEVEVVLHIVKDVTARVISEKNEQKLQLQHRHFVDNNPDGLYSLDVFGHFTSANEGLARVTEIPVPELLEMDFLPLCHPEDEEQILFHFNKAIAGEAVKFEARFVTAKGRQIIVEISLLPIRVNGKIEGTYGIAKDLTSFRKSQQIIVEKKKFLSTNASFISTLIENDLKDSSLEEAFALVGKNMKVDRMYYFGAHTNPESGENYLSQQVEWCSEKTSPQINNEDLQALPAKEVQQMLGLSSRSELYTALPNKLPDGELRDLFLQQDIQSVLIIPIFMKSTLHGFIGFDDCTKERRWSEEEIRFLQSLAHNLTTVLEKRAAQAALKEREEALVQSEKKFRALVQEGSDLIAILDEHGNYNFVSETSSRILDIPPEDFIGKNAFDFIHPEDRSTFVEEFSTVKKGGRTNLNPFRFRDRNNNWRWIEATITNLLHDAAVNGIVANARDITTVLDQAREIKHINERYRLAATATQDLMYDWNLVTDEVQRYHKTASFLGYPVEEVNQRAFWRTHIHPDELKGLREHLESILGDSDRTFINTKYRMRRADGTYAHFIDRAYIIRDTKGKAIRLVGATSDVSDLTDKKEALKAANERFEMAMEASNEMIWDWDIPTGRVKRSKALKEIYGYSESEDHPMNSYWIDKIHHEERDSIWSSLSAAIENPSQKKWREEYRFIRANGETAHVIDRGYILRNQAGKAIRMVGAVLDVTASRSALNKIEVQNKRLKEIAWEQSHVVRAPLARILGLLPLLKTEDSVGMSYNEIWGHVETSAKELDEIIRKIVTKTEKIDDVNK